MILSDHILPKYKEIMYIRIIVIVIVRASIVIVRASIGIVREIVSIIILIAVGEYLWHVIYKVQKV